MFQWLSKWTEKLRNRREAVSDAFYANKRYDLTTIEEKYSDFEKSCLNCKAQLTGPFCRACGQKDSDLRRPIWSFFKELLDALFDTDNKIFKTLILLVLFPGSLTRAFMDGKRASFSPPIRTYLVVSVLFFLFLSASNLVLMDLHVTEKEVPTTAEVLATADENAKNSLDAAIVAGAEPEQAALDLQQQLIADSEGLEDRLRDIGDGEIPAEFQDQLQTMTEAQKAALNQQLRTKAENGIEFVDGNLNVRGDLPFNVDLNMFVEPDPNRIGMDEETLQEMLDDPGTPEFVKNIIRGFSKFVLNPELGNEIFNDWLPRMLIIIIPLFAFILRLFHWGKKRVYLQQLIFSLHYHTFLFLLMGSLMIIIPRFGTEVGAAIFGWTSMIYLFIALKVAQDQGWIRTFFKFIFIWASYVTWISIGLFTALSLGLAEI